MKSQRLLHLVALGGNCSEYPQNTIPALRSAIHLGARFIGLDVRLAPDGVPVVGRDEDLDVELTTAELAQVEASAAPRLGACDGGTRVPALAQALLLIAQRPEVTALITIGRASLARFGRDQVVSQVLQALRPVRSRCIVVSRDLPAICRARELSDCRIGWQLCAYDAHTRLKYEAVRPEFLLCDHTLLPGDGMLWRGPWRWVIHDVTNLELALALAARGADFIGTGNVRAMSETMRAHAASSSAALRSAHVGASNPSRKPQCPP